jgi:hypothetical protein
MGRGVCATPNNVSAQIFQADGVTPVSPPLVSGTQFVLNFSGEPTCQWSITLLSPAGGVPPDRRLIVHYDAQLDHSTGNGIPLTNVAGVTSWSSADPSASAVTAHLHRELTDGTPGTSTIRMSTRSPGWILVFTKSVQNITTGQNPGRNASPGNVLRYTIRPATAARWADVFLHPRRSRSS